MAQVLAREREGSGGDVDAVDAVGERGIVAGRGGKWRGEEGGEEERDAACAGAEVENAERVAGGGRSRMAVCEEQASEVLGVVFGFGSEQRRWG